MNPISDKGFVIIIVCSVLAVLTLIASVIVSFGCSELLATRMRNDLLVSAYYVAISGAELMYANIKTWVSPEWDDELSGSVLVESDTIGTYSATVTSMDGDELCIRASGTVNGHTANTTLMLGYMEEETLINVGAYGQVSITGTSTQAQVKMDGPAASSTEEVIEEGVVADKVEPLSPTGLPKVNFWIDQNAFFDTDADGSYITGADPNFVTQAEAIAQDAITPGVLAEFDGDDDVNGDLLVDDKDAFIHYYTTWLNTPANNKLGTSLNIGEGESQYYSTDQAFDENSINDDVSIVFVAGNLTVDETVADDGDHTVVVLGNLTLNQPSADPGDRVTYVVFGNVVSTGEMGNGGGTKGDLVIFANGNIEIYGGGKLNASMFANGNLTIDTQGEYGYQHLILNTITEQWDYDDPDSGPLGIPPKYPSNPSIFSVKNQSDYTPVWQRE